MLSGSILALILLALVVLLLVLGADTIYINDDGIKANLDVITGKGATNIGAGTLRLFTAPVIVSHTNVIGDFTEANFTGYAAIALVAASWNAAAVAAHLASASYTGVLTFTRTATGAVQNIYGWFLTDAGKTKLYACALFTGGPVPMANNGDQVSVTPTLTDQSLN